MLITPIYAYYFYKTRTKCITSIVISYILIILIYFYYYFKTRMKYIASIVILFMIITLYSVRAIARYSKYLEYLNVGGCPRITFDLPMIQVMMYHFDCHILYIHHAYLRLLYIHYSYLLLLYLLLTTIIIQLYRMSTLCRNFEHSIVR